MGKSKSGGLARLPREQKCQFLIGPVSSWFMPNTTDIWSRITDESETLVMDKARKVSQNDSDVEMLYDESINKDDVSLSFFVYGSIGCFCYGEIHSLPLESGQNNYLSSGDNFSDQRMTKNRRGAVVNRLVDIKDDNSRVSCIRFLRQSAYPIVVALTESGSLLIHDCNRNENIVHFKKSEIFTKFLGLVDQEQSFSGDQGPKRTKFGVTQQINSCTWSDPRNIFLGISMIKEKGKISGRRMNLIIVGKFSSG